MAAYSVHRGGLEMLLHRTVVERLGVDAIRTGMEITGYRNHDDGCGVTALIRTRDGTCMEMDGALLIGADGLHSAVRAQMHPDQPPIEWGGAIMWRGTTPGVPIRTGASFVGLGTHRHRVVFYPISEPDPSPASRPSTGSRKSPSTTAAAGAMATGTRRSTSTTSSTTFGTGTTSGWTSRPCCGAPTRCSSIR